MAQDGERPSKGDARKTSAQALAKAVGRRISAARAQRQLSSEALAEAADVTRARLSVWENGRGLPDTLSLVQLCRALDVGPSELLGIAGPDPSAISYLPQAPTAGGHDPLREIAKRVDALTRIVLRGLAEQATAEELSDLRADAAHSTTRAGSSSTPGGISPKA